MTYVLHTSCSSPSPTIVGFATRNDSFRCGFYVISEIAIEGFASMFIPSVGYSGYREDLTEQIGNGCTSA